MTIALNSIPNSNSAESFNISIRKANTLDCDKIRLLYKSTVESMELPEYNAQHRIVWAASADDADAWLKRITNQYFIVAEHGGNIIGFGSVSAEGYLDLLYVDFDFQRKGVGRKILKNLESHCSKSKIHELWADVNNSSQYYFQRHGFIVDTVYTRSVKNCDFENVIMKKILLNKSIN
ncbi:GNAT family N-acetyltransferase [Pedobacter flavus]|uniref:GNAT family N-acetyltransferase n=1 Tax=Pedobacter flavus TaxID=3113906 RepID=A0ABU7GXM8_9SPHI|nr:GNAT family N-acetyltransferase [Pedobacter sp. VNH31]MEE1883813.1 GNAT family N-acetyltransferase [Pedobacter sp. VNH31]